MALRCVVKSCQFNPADIVFNFPMVKAKREKWLEALNMDLNHKFDGPSGVCERHFKKAHLRKVGSITLLAVNAVPDLTANDVEVPRFSGVGTVAPNNVNLITQPGAIVSIVPNNVTVIPQISGVTSIAPSNIAIKQFAYLAPSNIIIQPTPNQSIQQIPEIVNDELVLKMEIDDDNPQPMLNSLGGLDPMMALPMIEPDSIKIEVENVECNDLDPLDPQMDRIKSLQARNKDNGKLQAKMKEIRTKVNQEKKKLKVLKNNLTRNTKKYKELDAQDRQYFSDLQKITRLRNIYIKPELNIPKHMYDRYGMGDFDGLKYPKELKQFAIDLYSKSSVAYDYIREQLCNIIPHPDAILRWTKPQEPLANEE